MKRRQFLQHTSTIAALSATLSFPLPSFRSFEPELLSLLLEENDRSIPRLLAAQTTEVGPQEGGLADRYGLHHAMNTADFVQRLASSYIASKSEFYQSSQLAEAMQKAVGFLNRIQHSDGTIDLLTTNFHSTPDTAFVAEPLCLAFTLLKTKHSSASEQLRADLQQFLLKAGEALTVGGIHTPNHRWVVCMALARLNALFPNSNYVQRIDEWLAEKIDIDPDGQYNEKSTNIYSPLTNRCLITIARLLNKPELLEPVRRNLEMTLYYIHPNGEIATEASGRQDKYQTGTLTSYYYPYRYLALHDNNGRFAALTNFIPTKISWSQLVKNLAYVQEDDSLLQPLPKAEPLPENYVRTFPYSKLVRIRRAEVDATILGNNPTFFTFQKGDAVLQGVRLASAFFGKGQFSSETIRQEGNKFILEQKLEGPYYQPFPKEKLPDDGDWEKMPREERLQSEVQFLFSKIEIQEVGNQSFALQFDISGTENVPLAIELGFRSGGTFSGVHSIEGISNSYLAGAEGGMYNFEHQSIKFSPSQAAHSWVQLRGALPKLEADCVYITGFTPFHFTLKID